MERIATDLLNATNGIERSQDQFSQKVDEISKRFADADESLGNAVGGLASHYTEFTQGTTQFVGEMDEQFAKAVRTLNNAVNNLSQTIDKLNTEEQPPVGGDEPTLETQALTPQI